MAEDYELCTYEKHHKQKILLFLSSMRSHAESLKKDKFKLEYIKIEDKEFKDDYIEELNMSEKGWTEKLVIRLEKAVNEGSEEIELFLKPKELGSLKVNLLLNKNNAKIIFRAENNFVVQALQQSENLLTKLFNEQGMQIEATNYENNNFNNHSEFNSNNRKFKNGKAKSSDSRLEKEIEKEQIEIENSNYIINVKA